jgi:hypothetical protein
MRLLYTRHHFRQNIYAGTRPQPTHTWLLQLHTQNTLSTATLFASWTRRRRQATSHLSILTTYLPQIRKLKQIYLCSPPTEWLGTDTTKLTSSWIHKTYDYLQIRPRTRITAVTLLAGAPLTHLAGAQLITFAGALQLINDSALHCANTTLRTTLLTLVRAPTLVSLVLCCWRGETSKLTSTCHWYTTAQTVTCGRKSATLTSAPATTEICSNGVWATKYPSSSNNISGQ